MFFFSFKIKQPLILTTDYIHSPALFTHVSYNEPLLILAFFQEANPQRQTFKPYHFSSDLTD